MCCQFVYCYTHQFTYCVKTMIIIDKKKALVHYDEICQICQSSIRKDQHYINGMGKCNHYFHTGCFFKWLITQLKNHKDGTCPVCRYTYIKYDKIQNEKPITEDPEDSVLLITNSYPSRGSTNFTIPFIDLSNRRHTRNTISTDNRLIRNSRNDNNEENDILFDPNNLNLNGLDPNLGNFTNNFTRNINNLLGMAMNVCGQLGGF